MAKIVKTKFKIDGMYCTACAINIDFDLEDLDGVSSAKTNYAKQETEIEYNAEKLKLQQIIEQIKKTGYTVLDQK